MISIDVAGHRFQLRAAAVVVHDDRLLLHRAEGDTDWSLPGGRVEPGEAAADTVVREMKEELGEPVACGDLVGVVENFFVLADRPHHEVGLCFRATLRSDSRLFDGSRAHFGTEGDRRLEFRWFPLSALATLDMRPAALLPLLQGGARHVAHIVHRD